MFNKYLLKITSCQALLKATGSVLVVLGAMGYSAMESRRWGVGVRRLGMYVPDGWRLEGREGLSLVGF